MLLVLLGPALVLGFSDLGRGVLFGEDKVPSHSSPYLSLPPPANL